MSNSQSPQNVLVQTYNAWAHFNEPKNVAILPDTIELDFARKLFPDRNVLEFKDLSFTQLDRSLRVVEARMKPNSRYVGLFTRREILRAREYLSKNN